MDLIQDTLVAISPDDIPNRLLAWVFAELVSWVGYAVAGAMIGALGSWFFHAKKIRKLQDEFKQFQKDLPVRAIPAEKKEGPKGDDVRGRDEENLRQAQEKSRKLEEELAKERQEVEHLQTKVDLLKTKSTLFQQREEEKTRGLEEATRKLNERSEELAKCRESRNSLRYEFGRWRIDRCGTDGEYRNKSVRVQFIDLADHNLAEQTKEIFSIAWRVEGIEQILLPSENPSPDHRVVIFSNDENVGGVRSAINEHNLLGERVTNKRKKPDMEDDVTIVIFPEKGSED